MGKDEPLPTPEGRELEVSVSPGRRRHWHVTVTLSGEPVEPLLVRSALLRFSEERPFLEALRFTGDGAEISFWDEAESMLDVASLALRVWSEHRDSAGLPRWEVVGLEVVERDLHHRRGTTPGVPGVVVEKQEFRPLTF